MIGPICDRVHEDNEMFDSIIFAFIQAFCDKLSRSGSKRVRSWYDGCFGNLTLIHTILYKLPCWRRKMSLNAQIIQAAANRDTFYYNGLT